MNNRLRCLFAIIGRAGDVVVPRYYFDVWEEGKVARDDQGLELGSLEAAEREATRGAADMGRESLPKGCCSEVRVQVRNERGEPLLSVAVSMRVRREALVLAYAR